MEEDPLINIDYLCVAMIINIKNQLLESDFSMCLALLLNYPEQYKGDALNKAFAVELHDFIESSGVNYWIYGHHHNNVPDFKIGNTTMLTNQMGYVRANEHETFRTDAIFEI